MPVSTSPPLVLAPETIVGYHGCHEDTARLVLTGQPMTVSKNTHDWLGEGVYFWEYAPARAKEWALARFGEKGAVLKAEIRLGHCLNLLDTAYYDGLVQAYTIIAEKNAQSGSKMPVNRKDKRHFLDRLIVDTFCREADANSAPYQTARGCFPEGEPLYAGSKILRETHVQIAVRDILCISDVGLVK